MYMLEKNATYCDKHVSSQKCIFCSDVVMMPELIYYLAILLDQEGGGCHRAEHVKNAKVSYVRY